MKNSIYLFVLTLFIGFSSSVFAADWYTVLCGETACMKGGWSPQEACDSALAAKKAISPYAYWVNATIEAASGGTSCVVHSGTESLGWNVTKSQKSPCTVDDPSEASYFVPGYWSIGEGTANTVQNLPYVRPTTLCDGQCTGNVQEDVAECTALADGTVASPQPIHCTFAIKLTGAECTGGNGDAPSWNPATDKLCTNGASDYPTCTPPRTTCENGAVDFPTCTQSPQTCANGASNYPACTNGTPQGGTCSNGATNYPACTTGATGGTQGGTCINGATNYPTCTTPTRPDSSSATLEKVDESGTPAGVAQDAGGDGLDDATQERELGFADNTKRTELPWSFHFTLPSGSCTPISNSVNGRVISMDLCPWLTRVRDVIAYLWYGLASIYLWKRATSSTGAQA